MKIQILVALTALIASAQASAVECTRRAEAGRSEYTTVELEVEGTQVIKDCPFVLSENTEILTLSKANHNYCYYSSPGSTKGTACSREVFKK